MNIDIKILTGVIVRVLIIAFGGWLSSRGVTEGSLTDFIGGVLAVLLPAIQGYFSRTKLRDADPPA